MVHIFSCADLQMKVQGPAPSRAAHPLCRAVHVLASPARHTAQLPCSRLRLGFGYTEHALPRALVPQHALLLAFLSQRALLHALESQHALLLAFLSQHVLLLALESHHALLLALLTELHSSLMRMPCTRSLLQHVLQTLSFAARQLETARKHGSVAGQESQSS